MYVLCKKNLTKMCNAIKIILKKTKTNGPIVSFYVTPEVLKAYDFGLGRSKMEYMECKFSKRRRVSNLKVKARDHIFTTSYAV